LVVGALVGSRVDRRTLLVLVIAAVAALCV
jgi:hypothetical protein